VADPAQEAKAQGELLTEVKRIWGKDVGIMPSVKRGTDRMDYAVLTFESQHTANTFAAKCRDQPMSMGGERLNVQAGGWKVRGCEDRSHPADCMHCRKRKLVVH
jgi:hypothetical protein